MAILISSGSIDLCRHCSRGEAGGRAGKMVTAKNFASWESGGVIERRRFAAIFASDVLSPVDLLAAYPLCRLDRHGGRGGDPCRHDQGGGACRDRLGRRHHSVSDHRRGALCDCRHQPHPPQIVECPPRRAAACGRIRRAGDLRCRGRDGDQPVRPPLRGAADAGRPGDAQSADFRQYDRYAGNRRRGLCGDEDQASTRRRAASCSKPISSTATRSAFASPMR